MFDLHSFLSKLKRLWRVAKSYDDDLLAVERRMKTLLGNMYGHIERLEIKLNEQTVVHADVGWKSDAHQIVVCGKYRNVDFVKIYDVHTDTFKELVEFLEHAEKHAAVGRFDMPNRARITAVYPKERFVP